MARLSQAGASPTRRSQLRSVRPDHSSRRSGVSSANSPGGCRRGRRGGGGHRRPPRLRGAAGRGRLRPRPRARPSWTGSATRGSRPRPARRVRRGRGRGRARRARRDGAAQRHRPAVRHAAVPRRAGRWGHLPRHGHVDVGAAPGGALRADRRQARRRAVRAGRARGARPACSPWSASGSSRGCRTSSPATPRTTCSRRSTSSGVRDGADLTVEGHEFAPPFSIWTLIEECLNPPVVWERDRGWFTTPPFSEPEVFDFPAGIGPLECVNVEHEEVLLMPRWIDGAAGHVQVRAGREGDRRRCGRCTSSGCRRRRRCGCGARRRRGVAARGRGRLPARPRDARRRA